MREFGEKREGVRYERRPGSYGVIIEDGRAGVITSEEYEDYFLTGGGVEAGEDEKETLRREAAEEIGYRIEVGERLGEAVEYFYSEREGRHIAKECSFYRVTLKGKAVGVEKPKYELVWIKSGETGAMHHECYRWILEEQLRRA